MLTWGVVFVVTVPATTPWSGAVVSGSLGRISFANDGHVMQCRFSLGAFAHLAFCGPSCWLLCRPSLFSARNIYLNLRAGPDTFEHHMGYSTTRCIAHNTFFLSIPLHTQASADKLSHAVSVSCWLGRVSFVRMFRFSLEHCPSHAGIGGQIVTCSVGVLFAWSSCSQGNVNV